MITIAEVLGLWTTWALALVIGLAGSVIKKLVLTPKYKKDDGGYRGWRGVWFVTYKGHPLVVGSLCGLALWGMGINLHDHIEHLGGYVLWGSFVGVLASAFYALMIGNLGNMLEQFSKKKKSGEEDTQP